MNLREKRDELAKIAYHPLHPAWAGEQHEAYLQGWDACEAELLPLLREAMPILAWWSMDYPNDGEWTGRSHKLLQKIRAALGEEGG